MGCSATERKTNVSRLVGKDSLQKIEHVMSLNILILVRGQ
jgi:hypothetical protein